MRFTIHKHNPSHNSIQAGNSGNARFNANSTLYSSHLRNESLESHLNKFNQTIMKQPGRNNSNVMKPNSIQKMESL